MKRYAAIRLTLTLLIMLGWLLVVYLKFSFYSQLLFGLWLWAGFPFAKIQYKNIRQRPIWFQIVLWVTLIATAGTLIWSCWKIEYLNLPLALAFGFLFLILGFSDWSSVLGATDSEVDEVFGSCLGAKVFREVKV